MNVKTVLLADGDPDSRYIYDFVLQHHGYRVLQAGNGEEAFRLACEHRPDLAVVELCLGVIDGPGLTEQLKRDRRTAHAPVLVLSSRVMATDRERARLAGCDGFLSKPCKPGRMLEEVRRFIGPSGALVA